jgi:hypothetical protein
MTRPPEKTGSTGRDVFINFNPQTSDQTTLRGVSNESATQKSHSTKNTGPSKRFQFIDNSSASSSSGNSTQVRRHVMQEFMRQKRLQERKGQDDLAKGSETSRKRSVQRIKAQRRAHQSSQSTPSSAGSSPSPSATGSIEYTQSQPLDLPGLQHEAWADDQIEEIQRNEWTLPLVGKGDPDFFFLEPSAFAKLADISPDDSSQRMSISSCDSFSSIGSPMWSESSYRYVSPDPQSALSAARTDPFDCLPMTLSQQDQELFDFYANVMPACSYGFERRSPHAHNWYLSVFIPEAMKGAVCFQNTILVHAANTQAWIKRLTETPASIEHRVRASQMLSQHFQKSPTDASDASISAILSAAALEDFDPRVERRKYAWMHFRAAVQKIRDRGGPSALVQHTRLQKLINWSDYIFSGYSSSGPSFYFHHDPTANTSDPMDAHRIAVQEVREQCEEFITFLRCTEQLAFVQARIQRTPIAVQRQPMRYTAFDPGQPLERLLASPPGLRYTETGQLKQIISRLAALLTINTAIWEYRHSTEMSEEFFCELIENIKYNELDVHLSVEALIQILLSGSNNPALLDTERPWFVGRMLKVAKRLSAPSFNKLNDVLLSYLVLGSDLHPVMSDWENELRLEILEAPLTSYVLPLMQTQSSIVQL